VVQVFRDQPVLRCCHGLSYQIAGRKRREGGWGRGER
jgi:hypothetical protein